MTKKYVSYSIRISNVLQKAMNSCIQHQSIIYFILSIAMYLSGFVLYNQHLFSGQDSTEFFRVLCCPFTYGIYPYTFPAAMAIASLAYENMARKNKSHWHLHMFCVSSWLIAYVLMIGMTFLLSSPTASDTYRSIAIGKPTEKLVFQYAGIPYVIETGISMALSAIFWGDITHIISKYIKKSYLIVTYVSVLNALLNVTMTHYSIGLYKPFCLMYSWFGFNGHYYVKYIIKLSAILIISIVAYRMNSHESHLVSKGKKHKYGVILRKSVFIGCINCIISRVAFEKNFDIFSSIIYQIGGYSLDAVIAPDIAFIYLIPIIVFISALEEQYATISDLMSIKACESKLFLISIVFVFGHILGQLLTILGVRGIYFPNEMISMYGKMLAETLFLQIFAYFGIANLIFIILTCKKKKTDCNIVVLMLSIILLLFPQNDGLLKFAADLLELPMRIQYFIFEDADHSVEYGLIGTTMSTIALVFTCILISLKKAKNTRLSTNEHSHNNMISHQI